jgi:RNA polymerase sigma-70 factor (ECF subfamily)
MSRNDQQQKQRAADLDEVLQSGFRFAYSLTHHRQDAEDLVQRAWLRLHRRYSGCDSQALMFRTLRNLFYDNCRRAKIVPFTTLDEVEDAPGVEASLDQAPGVRGDLEVLLGLLEIAEREALYLNRIEGFTAAEIGELTGRSRNTVLGNLARAHRRLRAAAERDSAPESNAKTASSS